MYSVSFCTFVLVKQVTGVPAVAARGKRARRSLRQSTRGGGLSLSERGGGGCERTGVGAPSSLTLRVSLANWGASLESVEA